MDYLSTYPEMVASIRFINILVVKRCNSCGIFGSGGGIGHFSNADRRHTTARHLGHGSPFIGDHDRGGARLNFYLMHYWIFSTLMHDNLRTFLHLDGALCMVDFKVGFPNDTRRWYRKK